MNLEKEPPSYPWTKYFMAAAVRALRRVHDEYVVSSLPPLWDQGSPTVERSCLTRGVGLEYAPEVSVCAAIAQEFRRSNLGAGVWIPATNSKGVNVQAGVRNWKVEVEHPIKLTTDDGPPTQAYVDMVLQRVNFDDRKIKSERKKDMAGYAPVFLEAKRVRRGSRRSGLKGTNYVDMYDDANKLVIARDNATGAYKKQYRNHFETESAPFIHLLLWNCCEAGKVRRDSGEMPHDILKQIESKGLQGSGSAKRYDRLRINAMDWFPTDWPSSKVNRPAVKISRIAWVALIEVVPVE